MHKKFCGYFAVVLSLTFLVSCQTSRPSRSQTKAHYYTQIGTSEMMRQNYTGALRNFLEAKQLTPKDPIVLNNLAQAYFGLNEFQKAEQALITALGISSDYTDARNNLGALYLAVGKYKDAIATLSIATKDLTYEKPAQVWSNLGIAYFRTNQEEKSQKAFLKALDFDPIHCDATHFYGRSLYDGKKYKLAAETFDRAVDRCTNREEPYFYGALAYAELKAREKSAGRLRELLSQYPKSEYAPRAKKLLEIMQ